MESHDEKNRSESLLRDLHTMKTLNHQLNINVKNLELKVLQLEKDNARQLLIITRLQENNHLKQLSSLNSLSAEDNFCGCNMGPMNGCNMRHSEEEITAVNCNATALEPTSDSSLLEAIPLRDQVASLKFIRDVGEGFTGRVSLVEVDGLLCIAKRPLDIHPSSTDSKYRALEVKASFYKEISVLSQLRHPNIVQYIGVHCSSHSHQDVSSMLLMEYLPIDLSKVLSTCQGQFPLPLQLSILLDISLGMQYLHSKSIVHCDLTPKNILLSPSLSAKICDFGSSNPLGSRDITGYNREIPPSFCTYLPPEVFEPNFIYTGKLDVFVYGVTMLYVATQMFPVRYMGGEVSEEAVERGEVELERHREVFSMLNQCHCLASLIRECLQDDRDKRIHPADITLCLKSWLKVYPKQLEHVMELNTVIRDCLCDL